jgi:hypothetical protein
MLAILFGENLDGAMERIASVYPPGLRERLKDTKPEILRELDGLEDRLNTLAVAGDMKGAIEALMRWESSWLAACTTDVPTGQGIRSSFTPPEPSAMEIKTHE